MSLPLQDARKIQIERTSFISYKKRRTTYEERKLNMQNCEIIRINEDTWSIEDGFVRFFLLAGAEKALLIDSGVDIENVEALARSILSEFSGTEALPLELLNTHGDGDHCFGNKEFEWFYMHEADYPVYESHLGRKGKIVSVKDGDVLDLGDRPLEIIHIPGHTFGSIAVLDRKHRALFAGDSVQNGEIFMFGGHRNLDDYPASMLKLQEREDEFDVIYASHAQLELKPEAVGDCFDACESMLHGEIEPEEIEVHGFCVKAYDCETVTFLVDPDRKFMVPEEI